MSPRRRAAILGPTLVAAAVLFAHGRLLLDPAALIVDLDHPAVDTTIAAAVPRVAGNDLTRLYLPAHRRIAAAIRRDGRVPTWDPVGFGGRPIPANPQSGVWYPPVWLIWTIDRPAAWSWLTLAHLVWAGWGAFALARAIGVRVPGATLAGVAFALNPYLTAQVQAGHVPHVWAASWSGWAFAGLISGLRGRRVGWWRLSGSLGAAMVAGHPQEAYLLALAVLVWGLIAAAGGHVRRLPGLGMAMGGAAVLSAVVWLPAWLGLGASRTAGGVPAAGTTAYALTPAHFLQLIWPLVLGGPADYRGRGNYAELQLGPGVVAVALVALALVRGRRRRTLPWAAMIAVAWIVAAGRPLGLFPLLQAGVPGFDQMRVPARTLFLAALAAAVLAGLGLDILARRRNRLASPAAALLALELMALTWAVVRVTRLSEATRTDALDAAIARALPDRWSRVRAPEHLVAADRIDRLGLEVTDLYDWYQLGDSAALYEGLYAYGSPPRVWTRFDPWGNSFRERFRRGVLDRMGVGLVLGGPGLVSPPDPAVARVETDAGPVTLHAHSTALPRAYVVPRAEVVSEPEWRVAMAWLDPREAVLMSPGTDPLPPSPRQPYTPAEYARPANDRVTVRVRTGYPGLLVVADAWAEGWRAWLNGAEVPVLFGNHAQRVIALPSAGHHQIAMRYEPPGLTAGSALSGAGWIAWMATYGLHQRRSRIMV